MLFFIFNKVHHQQYAISIKKIEDNFTETAIDAY